VIAVLASYGLAGEDAYYGALEFWAALHGFVLLEMTGVMNSGVIAGADAGAGSGADAGADAGPGRVDTDAVFSGMVLRLAAGMAHRNDPASPA
jgi:hypothetical protein